MIALTQKRRPGHRGYLVACLNSERGPATRGPARDLRWLLCLLAAALLLDVSEASAQVLQPRISYQGMLRKGDGTTNAAGTQPIFFRIWDAPTGGTLYWSESQPVAIDTTGLFNVELGGGTPTQDNPAPKFSIADGISQVFQGDQLDQRWLELQVGDGSSAISPRQRFLAAPYAFGVANVNHAEGSFTVDQTLTVQGGADIAGAASLGSTLVVSNTATVGILKLPPPPSSGDPFAISPGTIDGDTAYMDIGDGPGWKLHMRGSGINVITFENEGKIGIKQTNPQAELDVNGTIRTADLTFAGATMPFMIRNYHLSPTNVMDYIYYENDHKKVGGQETGSMYDTQIQTNLYSAVIAGSGIRGGSWVDSNQCSDCANTNSIIQVAMRPTTAGTWGVMLYAGIANVERAGVDVLFIRRGWVDDNR
ncbi:MAG: hypothetical protein IT581_06360 [Verrucomicrobiales bacterium]|nr:hypothetical protein [Verrucomicrobiales bacterium]